MYRQRKSCLETGNALILLKDKKVRQEFAKLKINVRLVKNKSMYVSHIDAFNAGRVKGSNVQLVQGISNFERDSRKQLNS